MRIFGAVIVRSLEAIITELSSKDEYSTDIISFENTIIKTADGIATVQASFKDNRLLNNILLISCSALDTDTDGTMAIARDMMNTTGILTRDVTGPESRP